MKKIVAACIVLFPSIVMAWNTTFDSVVVELEQLVPSEYSRGVIADGTMLTLASPACYDPAFISKLRAKYKVPTNRRHITKLGYETLICNDSNKSIAIF